MRLIKVCPFCDSPQVRKVHKFKSYKCKTCNKTFKQLVERYTKKDGLSIPVFLTKTPN